LEKRAEQVFPGSEGAGREREKGEMAQKMYAHIE
jgi:hypothetical protein